MDDGIRYLGKTQLDGLEIAYITNRMAGSQDDGVRQTNTDAGMIYPQDSHSIQFY